MDIWPSLYVSENAYVPRKKWVSVFGVTGCTCGENDILFENDLPVSPARETGKLRPCTVRGTTVPNLAVSERKAIRRWLVEGISEEVVFHRI